MPPLAAFFCACSSWRTAGLGRFGPLLVRRSSRDEGILVRSLLHFSDEGLYWDSQKFVAFS
jgi:hypothetical protein